MDFGLESTFQIIVDSNTMMVINFVFFLFALNTVNEPAAIQPHITSYIDAYKLLAIDEMVRTGIPASVTIAQAIIESNAGSSKLARESNNHFGIKCKHYWDGREYFFPDDDRDAQGNLIPSCFRQYGSVEESYVDHSDFLMRTGHYKPLFAYDKTEYELWAQGLELCGYASDSNYAEKLIRTIELYGLHELDYYTVQYVEKSEMQNGVEFAADQK
ncbi:MAG TPA: glucosaminidase domain-containing protein [Saprospiraceae bacterium]|nr:glucosaminidase domain-containing protein [Saprospiraceae bacterium]